MYDRFSRPTVKAFISVLALNTPLKVFSEYDDKIIYGRCYKNADRDTSFEVFNIDELFNKFGEYIVDHSAIRDNILYIEIIKE